MIILSDDAVIRHAAAVFAADALLPLSAENALFDPALPLPPPFSMLTKYPDFCNLFAIVPEPYARLIEVAYVQMSDFAAALWPLVEQVVYAEPFFEWTMQADPFNAYYRDHIVHQVRVATIGDMLLHTLTVKKRPLLDWATDALRDQLHAAQVRDIPRFIRLARWFTALFHDCGYPYQYHHHCCGYLRTAYLFPFAPPHSADWVKDHGEALQELVPDFGAADKANCTKGKHSFFSAAEIAWEYRQYEESVRGRERDDRYRQRRLALMQLAVPAILRHHDAGRAFSFAKDPLSYLLILSDELHEACRPMATPGTKDQQTVIRFKDGPIRETHVAVEEDRAGDVTLAITYTTDGSKSIAGKTADEWREQQKLDLFAQSFALGKGELLQKITVEVDAAAIV